MVVTPSKLDTKFSAGAKFPRFRNFRIFHVESHMKIINTSADHRPAMAPGHAEEIEFAFDRASGRPAGNRFNLIQASFKDDEIPAAYFFHLDS